MVRKLMVVLLAGTICLLGATPLLAVGKWPGEEVDIFPTLQAYEKATGKKIEEFHQAPELKEKVAVGELPPVEERIPDEPMVLDPAVRIGKYGGVLKQSWVGAAAKQVVGGILDVIYEFPLTFSSDMKEIRPNIFKSWEIKEGGKVFIFHIREGMKWSDGAPFTADDFMFWYKDIALNKKLWPQPPSYLVLDGEVGKWEKIDDYTIKMSWSAPYGLLLERLCRWRPVPYAPAHYLKQFHPNYTPMDKIKKMMKKEGFTTWTDFFTSKTQYWTNRDTPTMCGWVMASKITDPVLRMRRNPYYWKIDTEGNQLPYIDEIRVTPVADVEALVLKAIGGDIDVIMGEYLGFIENITTLKRNEEKGEYEVVPSAWNNQLGAVFFNLSCKDPVKRKIFRDKRFRIALSVAMDREEINDIVFKGMARPSQPAPPEGPPYFSAKKPMYKLFTNYDPEYANYLLDKVGLDKWNADHTLRLRPDGKPFKVVLTAFVWWPQTVRIAEMYKKYWEDVGIGVTVKPIGAELAGSRFQSGMYEIATHSHTMTGWRPIWACDRDNVCPITAGFRPNWAWGLWYQTDGKEGEEPPPAVKRLAELADEERHTLSYKRRIQIEKEVHRIHSENLWVISAVTMPKDLYFHVITNRLKNVRKPLPMEMNPGQPSTWYIEE